MSGPSIHLTLPNLSLFKFPPDSLPPTLPPPSDEQTLASPFAIDPQTYNDLLHPALPLTIAGSYIVAVTLLNAYNRSRENKPWWISQTRAFRAFVILHNVFLAIFSAATFVAMLRAINHTWPGFNIGSGAGLAGAADALCKLQGPRGLGDAVTYNSTLNIWETKNRLIHLAPAGTPDPTDVGRLWNEGLAFWGWFFYLSKFYEVVDTLIILAKGKRSATLQTYHHAGAMMCMWAGMRYMSAPIWMFVFLNSAIHTLMYTYFTLSALHIRVPMAVKRALTTMQISQFIFGATFAAAHLFVKYDIPIETAYTIMHPISSLASVASSTASELFASATDAVASPSAGYGALLKRVLLRAAGDEGVAENVRDGRTGQIVMSGVQEAIQRYHEETRYRTDYHTIDCIDTTGQSFAIWLNIVYLAPLTALFVRFFIRAYTYRTSSATPKQTKRHALGRAGIEAAKGVDREVDDAGKYAERTLSGGIQDMDEAVRKDLRQVKEGSFNKGNRPVSDRVQSFERKATKTAEKARDAIKDMVSPDRKNEIKREAADSFDEIKENLKSAGEDAKSKTGEVADKTKEAAEETKDAAKETGEKASDKAEEAKDETKDSTSHLKVEADEEGDATTEGEAEGEGGPSTPSKKKKRKHKKKSHPATTNGEGDGSSSKKEGADKEDLAASNMTSSSMVDVAAEAQKDEDQLHNQ